MIKRYWNKKDEIKQKLINLDFKLYRYYSFESKYSLENLQNNIVFFSSPAIFNDPFDSNIGASFSQSFPASATLIEEKQQSIRIMTILKEVVSKVGPQNIYISFWKGFIKYFNYTPGIFVGYLDVLKYLFIHKRQRLAEQLSKELNIKDSYEYPVLDYLISDEAFLKYLGIKFKDKKMDITFEDYINIFSSIYRLADKEPDVDNYKILNDALIKIRNSMNLAIASVFKVACFCEEPTNILMWSHYANKHTGFCVEYDFKALFEKFDFDQSFCPVVYSKKRVSVVAPNKIKKNFYKGYDSNIIYCMDSVFTKSNIWSYEKEWRKVVMNQKDIDEFNDCLKISKVYLGANISSSNKKKILDICNEKGITVDRFVLDDSYYKLNKQ